MAKQNESRAKKGEGRLFIRTKAKKDYPAGTPGTKGHYWLAYYEPTGARDADGKAIKKQKRIKLKDEAGQPITKLEVAEEARKKIVRQVIAATEEERLAHLVASHRKATEEKEQAEEEANPPLEIKSAWDTYLSSNDTPETGEDTLKYYAAYWKRFRVWIGKKHSSLEYLRDISSKIAQQYATDLRSGDLTANTYNKHIGFLKLFFRVLGEPARLDENPFEKIKKRKLQTNVRRELTMEELKTILEKASGELQTLLMIGTFTGLRLGDCCTLKWGEVDLVRMQIKRVPNKLRHRSNARPVVVGIPPALAGKLAETPVSKRQGYVVPEYAELYTFRNDNGRLAKQPDISKRIRKHFRDTCGIQIYKEGTGPKKVPDPSGKHEYIWEHTGKRAVVEVGFHSLRHTYVSIQAERGTPQAVVQAIVGHGNPAMTAHYTHIGEQAARQAALAMPSNIVDAQFEELRDPIPDWAVELIKELTPENCSELKKQLLEENEKALMK